VIVGERSFGQALVKSILPLKDQIGALKLPVAAYFRPSGQNMNRYPDFKDSDPWGVTPDQGYEVIFTETEIKAFDQSRAERDTVGGASPGKSEFNDRQLQKALEYLDGQLALGRG
jgi:carboxyl-terminal processing protease